MPWPARYPFVRLRGEVEVGTINALSRSASGRTRNGSKQTGEASIRTFGVSLVAIAAVAAGVVLSKYRTQRDDVVKVPAGETVPVLPSLEAMRAAGM